jgi:KaiC/GvpD/RAD55 family RecA-like ATPase
MNNSEKRGAPRVAYVSDVVCEGEGTRLIARTSDISVSGVFIHSKVCCDAGSILRLKFDIATTQIETVGEVCYSIPQVGMGVRFLDLKREFHTAIADLIETHGGDSKNSTIQSRRMAPSGVEPVDQMLGGLERGQLYLAHGDTAGKSLFGIQFLLHGLRNGQRVALITSNLRVDAVRRFARLGYDCLGDVRRGSLVLFRSSPDLSEQVLHLGHLEPLLSELEPVLGKSSPERIVLDPVNGLLTGRSQEDVISRAKELSVWLRSFGSTVVLVANSENCEVIDSLTPAVRESFRFGVRENDERVVRFIAFEKSPQLADQAVRVDPSRGISVLQGQTTGELLSEEPSLKKDSSYSPLESQKDTDTHAKFPQMPADYDQSGVDASEEACDEFFAMLDELLSFASSPDLELAEKESGTIGQLNTQRVEHGPSTIELQRSID